MTSGKKVKSTSTWVGLLATGLYAGFVAAGLNILIYLTIIWIGGYDTEMVVLLSILVASFLPNLLAAVAYYSLLRITTKARSLFTIGVGVFVLVSILPHVGVGPPPSPALSLLPENFDLITIPLHVSFGATAIILVPYFYNKKVSQTPSF